MNPNSEVDNPVGNRDDEVELVEKDGREGRPIEVHLGLLQEEHNTTREDDEVNTLNN